MIDTKFYNVLLHSLAFLFMFTSFNTATGVVQRSLDGYIHETANSTKPFKNIDGYISNSVVYFSYATFNWLAPVILSFLKPKYTMFIGSILYATYLAAFIYPNTVILYIASVLLGLGAAMLWTSQGVFLTENSDDKTIDRNAGIFYGFENSTMVWGNIYIFMEWKGVEMIGSDVRVPFFIIFSILSVVGTLSLLFLRDQEKGMNRESKGIDESVELKTSEGQKQKLTKPESQLQQSKRTFLQAVTIVKTKNMLKNFPAFFAIGIGQTFTTCVYPTMVGASKVFGSDSDRLIGINCIVLGIGMMLGSLCWAPLAKIEVLGLNRKRIVYIGCAVNVVFSVVTFGLFPADSAAGTTYVQSGVFKTWFEGDNSTFQIGLPWHPAQFWLAILTTFFLGFADACIRVQVLGYIGWYYKVLPAPGFAIYHSIRSFFCGISFLYAKWSVFSQCLILIIGNVLCIVFFAVLEHEEKFEDEVRRDGIEIEIKRDDLDRKNSLDNVM